jgi:hypothetical protein
MTVTHDQDHDHDRAERAEAERDVYHGLIEQYRADYLAAIAEREGLKREIDRLLIEVERMRHSPRVWGNG